MHTIYQKLGVRGRVDLTRRAFRSARELLDGPMPTAPGSLAGEAIARRDSCAFIAGCAVAEPSGLGLYQAWRTSAFTIGGVHERP